jgi:hypothetical protein
VFSSIGCPFILLVWPLYLLSFHPFGLAIVFVVLLSFWFGNCIGCPFILLVWPLYWLSFYPFGLAIVFVVLLSIWFGHCICCPFILLVWPLYWLSFYPFGLDNKNNGQTKRIKGQPIQWPNQKDKRTTNTMAKPKG